MRTCRKSLRSQAKELTETREWAEGLSAQLIELRQLLDLKDAEIKAKEVEIAGHVATISGLEGQGKVWESMTEFMMARIEAMKEAQLFSMREAIQAASSFNAGKPEKTE